MRFQSTRSARSATSRNNHLCKLHAFSIHALREERDGKAILYQRLAVQFSIHALREERDW